MAFIEAVSLDLLGEPKNNDPDKTLKAAKTEWYELQSSGYKVKRMFYFAFKILLKIFHFIIPKRGFPLQLLFCLISFTVAAIVRF